MKYYLCTIVVMKCESVYSGCRKLNNHLYKALLNRLASDKNFTDTLSRNFYQHHSFYNLLMSLNGKNKVTCYKPDRSSSTLCCRLRSCSDSRLRFAISVAQDNYNVQEKQKAMILFFSVVEFNIFSAALTSSL